MEKKVHGVRYRPSKPYQRACFNNRKHIDRNVYSWYFIMPLSMRAKAVLFETKCSQKIT